MPGAPGPGYVELQVTTNYSFLRGASHVEELFLAAKALGLPAIGVTDHNTLAGIARAHARAGEVGIRLVVGCRLDLHDSLPVLVYPTDRAAYARLCRLLTLGKGRAGKRGCDLAWADLVDGGDGLIAVLLPDAADAALGQTLARLQRDFTDRCYLSLKAGLPRDDTRGRITSHRGRATLATRLYNSTSGFTSLEAMHWLGHATLASGQHYVELVPTRLMTAFHRSTKLTEELRCVGVLVDGRPGPDDPVLRYDLGHGWCTNPAYAACAHRMACARCSFYETTEAFAPLLTQQAGRFVEMLQRLDLTDSERPAVEGDTGAVQLLLAGLAGQPTPDGKQSGPHGTL